MLPDDVIAVLSSDRRISKVELTGSRASGQATPLSDWDFAVTATAFGGGPRRASRNGQAVASGRGAVGQAQPHLVLHADPAGPAKVDLPAIRTGPQGPGR
jgi:hypothetical protein